MRSFVIVCAFGCLLTVAACAPKPPERKDTQPGKVATKEAKSPGSKDGGTPTTEKVAPDNADVPKLIASLASATAADRWAAARSLADLGPAAAPAVPALTKALADDEPRVRGHAARALGLIQDKSATTVSGLVKLAADPEPLVRRAAVTALGRLHLDAQTTTPLLTEALRDKDPAVVVPALAILSEAGVDALPVLVEALKAPQSRYWASLALAEMGPQAKDAVAGLTELLKADEAEVRTEAALALGEIGPDAVAAAEPLAAALADQTPAVRYAAAFSLGKIGAAGSLPALEKARADQDHFLRLVAAWAVAKLKPDDKQATTDAVELIVAGLKDDNPNVRRGAARALLELDAPADVVGPALVPALEDADPVVRANVHQGLASLGQRAVPRLIDALNRPQARDHALAVLRLIGAEAASAVPALTEMLAAGQDDTVRRELLFTLAAIGPASAPATETISKLLASQDEEVRVAAGYALGKIGPDAAAAADELRKNLESHDRMLRLVSIWALLRIEPDNSKIVKIAVPALSSLLAEAESELARTEAAAALGEIGAAARPARPALEKALHDDSPAVRAAAAEALRQIGS